MLTGELNVIKMYIWQKTVADFIDWIVCFLAILFYHKTLVAYFFVLKMALVAYFLSVRRVASEKKWRAVV